LLQTSRLTTYVGLFSRVLQCVTKTDGAVLPLNWFELLALVTWGAKRHVGVRMFDEICIGIRYGEKGLHLYLRETRRYALDSSVEPTTAVLPRIGFASEGVSNPFSRA
jgi:hypothetical protein